jgi:molybdate transport system substrate-binding protein
MTMRLSLLPLLAGLFMLVSCGSKPEASDGSSPAGTGPTSSRTERGEARELTVFAAASLREALEELAAIHTDRTGTRVTFNFAGSNELAKQIVAARGADLFLSAAENWMDTVERAKRIVDGTRHNLLSNSLVVVGHKAGAYTITGPCDLAKAGFTNLALGDPESVPAGKYAKQWLSGVQCDGRALWDALASKVAPSPDVRAALGLVLADPKFVGIVYRTDQLAFVDRTKVLHEVKDGPPIRYALAQVAEGGAPEDARAFTELLNGADGRKVFEKHGFTVTSAVASGQ